MSETTSGYTHCACRDCMDVCVTADGGWTLCLLCLDAGCTPWPGEGKEGMPSHTYDCQREDACGADVDPDDDYIYRPYHRRDCPTPVFHTNPGHVCPEPGELS